MPTKVDVRRLGMLMRSRREREELTLKDVSDQTGLKIPTLSRIERGASRDIEGGTLLTLTRWLGSDPEDIAEGEPIAAAAAGKTKVAHTTPDVVELYLRADKNLDKTTAAGLSTLFRTAYATMSKQIRAKKG